VRYKSVTQVFHLKIRDLYQFPFSTTNVVDYGVNNTWIKCRFPATRHYFRMMCDKDILQLFFEDLNSFMSPFKISYHYIRPVTVSSSNRHQVFEGCPLSRHVLIGHLDPWRREQLVFPKRQNGITLYAPYDPRRWQVSKHVQLQCVYQSAICQMFQYKCVLGHSFKKRQVG